ncbi:MAG TPA: hypothetical protein VGO40_05910 [Longimicrobium sp.]|nr:hypothetical protein [Longimicrobium sp.]
MAKLWTSDTPEDWQHALDAYEGVIDAQGVARLAELDRWYRDELPAAIAGRSAAHVTHEELVRTTEWKMARGIWRGRNLALVRGNPPEKVVRTSTGALAAIPDPKLPIARLAELDGVGPATASAIASAAAPEVYPFFDELVAAQVPGLGEVAFTPAFYAKYADALRQRASRLGWTPVMVERALWAHVGGKKGTRGR